MRLTEKDGCEERLVLEGRENVEMRRDEGRMHLVVRGDASMIAVHHGSEVKASKMSYSNSWVY